jgi:WD40 repeat protein
MPNIRLADLIAQGVRIEPFEAVAIAQLLVENGAVAPSPENVELCGNGDVRCVGCDVTPAVFEIGGLLHTLIPAGTPHVSGGLRYAIARALLDVDAPPFDSIDDFSRSLERFERGDRRMVVRQLVGRHLRPALRIVPRPASAAVVAMPLDPRPRRPGRALAAAAAAALIGAVGLMGVAHVTGPGPVRPRTVVGAGRTNVPAPAPVVEARPAPAIHARASTPRPTARVATTRDPSGEHGEIVAAIDGQRRPIFSQGFASNGSALFLDSRDPRDAERSIATAPGDDAGGGDLGVMTIADDGARNYHVQLSPDGAQIAFDSDRDGERGVYLARRDGMNVRRISGSGYAAVPTWAPDGRRVAYIRAEADNPAVWNLWLQPLGADRPTRLTSYQHGQTWSASWFPDGRRICYSHEETLVVLDLDSGSTRTFASPVKGRPLRSPAVSPDGTQVIFQVVSRGAWILDLRDDAMRSVVADPTAEEFAWSPDGRRVAFHSRRDGRWGIFVISRT